MNLQCKVEVKDVSIAFGDHTVLKSLNIDVDQSEFLVLLGPSGCGKSTLLNAIAGLQSLSKGQIWIGEKNVTWKEPKDRGIAMVFQSYALYPRMTVRGNMSFGSQVAGLPAPEINSRVTRAAEMLKLTDLLERRPSELSGGQRQRVAIGRALVKQAGVFLFDEPLSNLDAQLRAELRVEIKRLHQQLGATMIYVTHDQIEAMTLADRIAVMQGGVIQQLDTPQKIYREPANRFVASFVGSPAMNFINGQIEGEEPGAFVSGNAKIALKDYCFKPGRPASKAVLGIRPEDIIVASGDMSAAVPACVEIVEPMGADSLVWCSLEGTTVSVRVDGRATVKPKDVLHLILASDRISLFNHETGQRI